MTRRVKTNGQSGVDWFERAGSAHGRAGPSDRFPGRRSARAHVRGDAAERGWGRSPLRPCAGSAASTYTVSPRQPTQTTPIPGITNAPPRPPSAPLVLRSPGTEPSEERSRGPDKVDKLTPNLPFGSSGASSTAVLEMLQATAGSRCSWSPGALSVEVSPAGARERCGKDHIDSTALGRPQRLRVDYG